MQQIINYFPYICCLLLPAINNLCRVFYGVHSIVDHAYVTTDRLRRREAAVIEYWESLEERGMRSSEEIERKVAIRLKQLKAEYGLLDSNDDSSGNSKCPFSKLVIYNIVEFVIFLSTYNVCFTVELVFRFAYCFPHLLILFYHNLRIGVRNIAINLFPKLNS